MKKTTGGHPQTVIYRSDVLIRALHTAHGIRFNRTFDDMFHALPTSAPYSASSTHCLCSSYPALMPGSWTSLIRRSSQRRTSGRRLVRRFAGRCQPVWTRWGGSWAWAPPCSRLRTLWSRTSPVSPERASISRAESARHMRSDQPIRSTVIPMPGRAQEKRSRLVLVLVLYTYTFFRPI